MCVGAAVPGVLLYAPHILPSTVNRKEECVSVCVCVEQEMLSENSLVLFLRRSPKGDDASI